MLQTLEASTFEHPEEDKRLGGGSVFYFQAGGPHADSEINTSRTVLGHELFQSWSYEFTLASHSMKIQSRFTREKMAVSFENYLRALFGERVMRTKYSFKETGGQVNLDISANAEFYKKYKLPNFQRIECRQRLRDADNTVNKYKPTWNIDSKE